MFCNVSPGSGVVIARYTYMQVYKYLIVDIYCLECFAFKSFDDSFLETASSTRAEVPMLLETQSNWPLLIGSE